MNLKTSNDHNVYILGAGFSDTAGLPLMATFLNRMRDALEGLQREGRVDEAQAIGKVLEYRLQAASAAYWSTLDLENIEQLFSLASAARHEVGELLPTAMAGSLEFCRKTGRDGKVRVQLYDSSTAQKLRPPNGAIDAAWIEGAPQVFHRIEQASREGRTTSHLAALLGMVNEKSNITGTNTFITFNYDTLVEDALAQLQVPWTYGFPTNATAGIFKDVEFESGWGDSKISDAVPVLKLHGSVNWSVEKASGDLSQLRVYRSYDSLASRLKRPHLLPPTWSKNVDNHLSFPWTGAIERLQTATRVVVIGFSMPETDLHFRYLLSAGLQKNAWLRTVIFVNPDSAGVEARARVAFRKDYIDRGLIRFVPLTAEAFCSALLAHRHAGNHEVSVDIGRHPAGQLGCWTPAAHND